MNILIYGNAGSGKTLLAELLQEHYEREGQRALIENELIPNPARYGVMADTRQTVKLLEHTLHDPRDHTIITTQATQDIIQGYYDALRQEPASEGDDALFDYYYHLTRSGPMIVSG